MVAARAARAQGLALDAILPPGLGTLLPNLRQLLLDGCALTPAARTTVLDLGCSRLQRVLVHGLAAQPAAPPNTTSLQQLATAQLRQLSKLPSLDNVTLKDSSCPTLFLVALGTQLTRLDLYDSFRQCEPGTQTPTPGWRATLQHVARCTRLRELVIPCQTAEELGVVAPALRELRALCACASRPADADGDAVIELLLGLPCLTSLTWDNWAFHRVRRSYVDRPCRWEALAAASISAQQLGRLPLHSLARPFEWRQLVVPEGTALSDVRAAAANVTNCNTRCCTAGFRWASSWPNDPARLVLLVSREDVPAVLTAVRPLFQASALASVDVGGVLWDVTRVKVLGEVLPRTCEHLALSLGGVSGEEALEQWPAACPGCAPSSPRSRRACRPRASCGSCAWPGASRRSGGSGAVSCCRRCGSSRCSWCGPRAPRA